MPIAIIRPTGIGTEDEWTLSAGATKFDACDPGDPVSHDEDTTRCQADAGGGADDTEDFTVGAMPGAATGVRSVKGIMRWRTPLDSNQTMSLRARLNAVLGTDTTETKSSSGSYTDFEVDPLPRPGSGAWTLADLADSTLMLRGRAVTNPTLGALRITSFWMEVTYIESAILPYDVQTGSVRVVFFSSELAVYKLKVHHRFLANENIIDLMNLADSALPVAPSVLEDLKEHGLLDKWRRKVVIPAGQNYLPSEHAMEFTFLDYEPIMATFFSTLVSPFGTPGDTLDGVARFDGGATWTVDRGSRAFVEGKSNIVPGTANQEEGVAWQLVPDGREKINHEGLLAEGIATNKLLNSGFKLGTFTSWSNVLNGGSFSANTQKLVFPSAVSTKSFDVSRSDDANDSYTEQSIAVLSADSFRRTSFIHSEDDATSIASMAIQRDTDSRWWDDALASWEVAKSWLNAPNSFDSVNSLEKAERVFTKPMSVGANENWLIQVGMEGASLPAGGGDVRIYHVQCTVGKLRYSPIVTEGVAVTTSADTITGVLDAASPVRQMHYAGRGTISFEFVAEQDGGDLVDATWLVLAHIEYGTAAGDAFDSVLYQKIAGQNARFSFERHISGALDARATFDIVIVKGTVYRIRALATSDSDGELGLAPRTMRIAVDEIAGTDATASATHSTSEKDTAIWLGSAPSAVGFSPAMNIIRRLRMQPRVVSLDEKIL